MAAVKIWCQIIFEREKWDRSLISKKDCFERERKQHFGARKWVATSVTLAYLEHCSPLFLHQFGVYFPIHGQKVKRRGVSGGQNRAQCAVVVLPWRHWPRGHSRSLPRRSQRSTAAITVGDNGRMHREQGCGLANSHRSCELFLSVEHPRQNIYLSCNAAY